MIKLRGDTDDIPENVALAFSVLMLFMLCEPRDGVTVRSLREGYTPGGHDARDQTSSHENLYRTNPRTILFFVVIGYNEETPSNSHLYLASRQRQEAEHGAAEAPGDEDARAGEDLAQGDPGDDPAQGGVFCPWEQKDDVQGVDYSAGEGEAACAAQCTGAFADDSYAVNADYTAGGGEAACGAACAGDL